MRRLSLQRGILGIERDATHLAERIRGGQAYPVRPSRGNTRELDRDRNAHVRLRAVVAAGAEGVVREVARIVPVVDRHAGIGTQIGCREEFPAATEARRAQLIALYVR